MLFLIVFVSALLIAVSLGLLAAWSDYRGMVIPNIYSFGIIVAFVFAYMACHLGGQPGVFDPLSLHLKVAGAVFFVTLLMWIAKALGGGDSKLLTAFALWAGLKPVIMLLFVMAISGFFLATASVLIGQFKPFKNVREGSWIAKAQAGQKVIPYGIPIVLGALFMFYDAGYFDLQILQNFLEPPEPQ